MTERGCGGDHWDATSMHILASGFRNAVKEERAGSDWLIQIAIEINTVREERAGSDWLV